MEMLRYPIIALVIGWILGAVFTKLLLPYLEKKQFKQFVREVGPQSHLSKTGTPSMGGLAIIGASVLASTGVGLAAGVADGWHLVVILLVMVLFGCIGFIDDYEKAIKKNNAGISPKQKIILQFVFSGAFAIYAYLYSGFGTVPGSAVWIPFVDRYIDFGLLYIPFIIFVMIAFSNAVNLTDGLDGLASGVTAAGGVLHGHFRRGCLSDDHCGADCLRCSRRCLSGLPDVQQEPGTHLHGRHRLDGARWRFGGGGGHVEDGISGGNRGAALCAGSALGHHPGGIFQKNAQALL